MADVFTSNIQRMGFQPGLMFKEQLYEFFELVTVSDTSLTEKQRFAVLRERFTKRKEMYPSRTLLALRATPLSLQKDVRTAGAIYRLVQGESRLFDLSEVMIYDGPVSQKTKGEE